jgi:hypothetical protein
MAARASAREPLTAGTTGSASASAAGALGPGNGGAVAPAAFDIILTARPVLPRPLRTFDSVAFFLPATSAQAHGDADDADDASVCSQRPGEGYMGATPGVSL